MADRVSPLARACCFALLSLLGCRGGEHQLFREIFPPEVDPPASVRDAGVRPTDEAGTGGGAGAAAAGGGAPEAGASGGAGGAPRDPDLDPTVTFPWTETLPGKGTCREGLYIGRFTCTSVDAEGIAGLFPWTGQVVFTLGRTDEKGVLQISNGMLADDFFPFLSTTAMLNGSLKCLNMHRLEGRLTGESKMVFEKFDVPFVGWLDPETLVIKGGFELWTPEGVRWSCTWQANAAP